MSTQVNSLQDALEGLQKTLTKIDTSIGSSSITRAIPFDISEDGDKLKIYFPKGSALVGDGSGGVVEATPEGTVDDYVTLTKQPGTIYLNVYKKEMLCASADDKVNVGGVFGARLSFSKDGDSSSPVATVGGDGSSQQLASGSQITNIASGARYTPKSFEVLSFGEEDTEEGKRPIYKAYLPEGTLSIKGVVIPIVEARTSASGWVPLIEIVGDYYVWVKPNEEEAHFGREEDVPDYTDVLIPVCRVSADSITQYAYGAENVEQRNFPEDLTSFKVYPYFNGEKQSLRMFVPANACIIDGLPIDIEGLTGMWCEVKQGNTYYLNVKDGKGRINTFANPSGLTIPLVSLT